MNRTIYSVFCFLLLGFGACKPEQSDDFGLTGTAAAPEFSVEILAGPENKVVVKDLSQGAFQRLWEAPGGVPNTSIKQTDTIAYAKAGTYTVTLHASKASGEGTGNAKKVITVLKDAPLTCNPKLSLLTGECTPVGKCWTMSKAVGAIKVGPTYDDYSWFTSTLNGLQNEQYDDSFCFTFDKFVYQNKNNGVSVDPWDGYKAIAYAPPVGSYVYREGTGRLGRDQLILSDKVQFMGVWDCDPTFDVVKLTASQLVVRGRQRERNGTVKTEGWFELTLVPK
jgi:PKD repeat protein